MSALFKNDRRAEYPNSWYADSADIAPQRAPLGGRQRADVCIVGAGYAGLSAAIELRKRGYDVAVVEAHRAGFGASGRNGGQVGSGFNKDQPWFEKHLGADQARMLWDLAEEAKALTIQQTADYAPKARFTPGVAFGGWSEAEAREAHQEADHLRETYGYDKIEKLDRDAFQAIVGSPVYHGGTLDHGAGHLHPLRYVLGLARAADQAGVRIFERSAVHRVTPGTPARVQTDAGEISADHVILAGNGYLPNLDRFVAARTMPINSFIAATEPLGDRAQSVLARDIAVADSKFVVNYFRLSDDGRLLFGGRESYSIGFPRDIETRLRARMEHLFPQLAGVQITHIWGGTLGITPTRLPLITRTSGNVLSVGGFSGHGVALAALSGKIAAEAIDGQAARFDTLSALPTPRFPGGTMLRAPLLTAAMTWFSLRDRLGI